MTDQATTSCPNCAALEGKITELMERIAALEAELAKAKKNSGNFEAAVQRHHQTTETARLPKEEGQTQTWWSAWTPAPRT